VWACDTMGKKLGERLMGLLAQPSVQKAVDEHVNFLQSSKREREREREIREVHTPLNFVNTLSGYATMERKPGERLTEQLEDRGVEISGEFDSLHVSDTLSVYATMGRKPGERLIGLLEERMEAISGTMNSQNISKLLWMYPRVGKTLGKKPGETYTKMGRKPGERLMGLLEGRMETISVEFTSTQVSQTLWTYATMGRRYQGFQVEACFTHDAGVYENGEELPRKLGERLMGLLEGWAEAISGEFDSDDVSR
jgi:hypothetical protein